MTTFYITFGSPGIMGGFVILHAPDEGLARSFCADSYGAAWSGFYTEDDWEPQYFPQGMFGEVTVP